MGAGAVATPADLIIPRVKFFKRGVVQIYLGIGLFYLSNKSAGWLTVIVLVTMTMQKKRKRKRP